MATLSEIIYNIKNLQAGGLQSDDVELADEQIMFIVDYYREKLIHEDYRKHFRTLDNLSQSLGLVTIETDVTAFPTLDKDFRITKEIPQLVLLPDGAALTMVGRGVNNYQRVEQNRAALLKYARFTSDLGYCFPYNNRVVLILGDVSINKIPIEGIFRSPLKAKEFKENKKIYDYDFEYPISARHLELIYKLIMQGELNFSLSTPKDDTNDTSDS